MTPRPQGDHRNPRYPAAGQQDVEGFRGRGLITGQPVHRSPVWRIAIPAHHPSAPLAVMHVWMGRNAFANACHPAASVFRALPFRCRWRHVGCMTSV